MSMNSSKSKQAPHCLANFYVLFQKKYIGLPMFFCDKQILKKIVDTICAILDSLSLMLESKNTESNSNLQISRMKIDDPEMETIRECLSEMSNCFLRVYEQFSDKPLNDTLYNSRNSNLQKMVKMNSMLSNDKIFSSIMVYLNKECGFNCNKPRPVNIKNRQ